MHSLPSVSVAGNNVMWMFGAWTNMYTSYGLYGLVEDKLLSREGVYDSAMGEHVRVLQRVGSVGDTCALITQRVANMRTSQPVYACTHH